MSAVQRPFGMQMGGSRKRRDEARMKGPVRVMIWGMEPFWAESLGTPLAALLISGGLWAGACVGAGDREPVESSL